jgi:multidrug resistance efflux pump
MLMMAALYAIRSGVILSRVGEVMPNISGQIVDMPVRLDVPVRADPVLFRIDRAARRPAKTREARDGSFARLQG